MRYSFNGTASGALGAQQFTNISLSIVGIADINNLIVTSGAPGKPVSYVTNLMTSMELFGIGSGNFLSTIQTVDNKVTGLVGFGDLTQHIGLMFGRNPLFESYLLTDSIGPVPVTLEPFLVFDTEPTTIGVLSLSSISSVTFQAMPVPEPSAWVLSSLGVAIIGACRYLRSRK